MTERAGSGPERPHDITLIRKVLAEFVGTYLLTLVGAGVEIVAVLKPGTIDRTVKALAPGLIVATMIYSFGDVSGAHLNPVVTLMFTLRRVFPSRCLAPYWAAQLTGAIAAAATLRALFGSVRQVGIDKLDVTAGRGVVLEALLTFVLVLVIVNTAHKHSLIGTDAALAVGAAIVVGGLVAGELTTSSMNPARAIGPAIISGQYRDLWVFIVGPVVGALAALGISTLVHPHRNDDEDEAAQGDDAQTPTT